MTKYGDGFPCTPIRWMTKSFLRTTVCPLTTSPTLLTITLMKITHVIRGEEWLPSAPLHVLLYRYLGWGDIMPKFAHLPLLLKPDGKGKLSKRDGDRLGFPVFPLEWKDPESGETSMGYREMGYIPEAVINLFALLGWHPSDNREIFSMEELCEEFTLDRVSKSGAKFDFQKAKWFNHKYLMDMDNSQIAEKIQTLLKASGPDNYREAFDINYITEVVALMKEKVDFANDIPIQGHYFFSEPSGYDEKILRKKWNNDVAAALAGLENELRSLASFNSPNIQSVFEGVAARHDLSPGAMMPALRLVLPVKAGTTHF